MGDFQEREPVHLQSPEGPTLGDSAPSIEFVSLFLSEQRRLHRHIVTLLSRQQDADDLLQETATVLWRKFEEFERGTSFFSWACRTAYLVVLEYRRRQGHKTVVLDNDVLENIAALSMVNDATLDVRVAALEKCLDKLLPNDRHLIERSYFAKIKPKDLAAELRRPEKSIYRSLGRIRRVLINCVRRAFASAEHQGGSP